MYISLVYKRLKSRSKFIIKDKAFCLPISSESEGKKIL